MMAAPMRADGIDPDRLQDARATRRSAGLEALT